VPALSSALDIIVLRFGPLLVHSLHGAVKGPLWFEFNTNLWSGATFIGTTVDALVHCCTGEQLGSLIPEHNLVIFLDPFQSRIAKGRWSKAVKAIWKKIIGDRTMPVDVFNVFDVTEEIP
jgi:hypothetical protein